MFVDITEHCFALLPQVNFPTDNLNFHWRLRRWDQIQAIFLNFFYFNNNKISISFYLQYFFSFFLKSNDRQQKKNPFCPDWPCIDENGNTTCGISTAKSNQLWVHFEDQNFPLFENFKVIYFERNTEVYPQHIDFS